MRSVMQHNFSQIPAPKIQRSTFDMSHGYRTTFDAGYLIPFFRFLAYPGDTLIMKTHAFARLATPQKPIFDNLRLTTQFWKVPIRQIWENAKEFFGEQPDPDPDFSSPEHYIPQMVGPNYAAGGIAIGSLSDYLGLPTGPLSASNTGVTFNSWYHRAYNWIWNCWYRDENLQDRVVVDVDDGPDTYTDYVLLRRGKRKDMFTSALPYPQKGPDVLLPLGDYAPVLGIGKYTGDNWSDGSTTVYESDETQTTYANCSKIDWQVASNTQFFVERNPNAGAYPFIRADLSNAVAATINNLREAWQIQRLYERDARNGSRYYELIKSHFGVTDPGALIQQIPEYLGGGVTPINVHPVAQTNNTGATGTPQGNLAAFGTASIDGSHGFVTSTTEHCLILGLLSVSADLTYQTGLHREFSLRSRMDMYWPAFANLGEDAILNKEIFCDGSSTDDEVFGYQERFYYMRNYPSMITGLFRSSAAASLDVWHLSQDFGATCPVLGPSFIEDTPPIDRVVAVPGEPHFLIDIYNDFKAVRPMPVFSIPGLVDHF